MITSAQMRAARALLNWKQEDLATQSKVPMRTVQSVESEGRNPRAKTLSKRMSTYEAAGIIFSDDEFGQGVVLRKKGAEGN